MKRLAIVFLCLISCNQKKEVVEQSAEDIIISRYISNQAGSAKVIYQPGGTLLIDSVRRGDILTAWLKNRNEDKDINQHAELLLSIVDNQEKLMKMTRVFSPGYPDDLYNYLKIEFLRSTPDSLAYVVIKKRYSVNTPGQVDSSNTANDFFFIQGDSVVLSLSQNEIEIASGDKNDRINTYEKVVKERSIAHGKDLMGIVTERMYAQLPK